MTKPAPTFPLSSVWVERYEQLRRHFLEGAGTLAQGTLALQRLLAQGMAGWMNAWTEVANGASGPSLQSELAAPALPNWRSDLTSLLAQMSLPHFQSERL